MARLRSSSASNKHKSSSKDRHGSSSVQSKTRRVSFGEASSDFRTNIPLRSRKHKDKDASKAKNTLIKKPSAMKSRSSDKKRSEPKEIPAYSSTSGILKSRDKHNQRPIHSSKSSKSSHTSTKPKPKPKKRNRKTPAVHPYAARFADSIRQRTTHLLTILPQQLKTLASVIYESLLSVNNCNITGKSYKALGASHQASILAKYGSPIPMGVVTRFQENCKGWEREFKTQFEEYNVVQQELVTLAKEIGLGKSVDRGNRDGEWGIWDPDSDAEFEVMVKEIKKVGKTYITKMDKLEKQIFQEESRQNMLMMQAL